MAANNNEKIVLGLDIQKTTQNIRNDLKKVISRLDGLDVLNLDQPKSDMQVLENLGSAFKKQLEGASDALTECFSASAAVMAGIEKTKESIRELKEIDSLLSKIQIANSSLSKTSLTKIGTDAFSIAGTYGKKATDYLSDVQIMSSAGYKEAAQMAELSIAVQSAGDLTSELANKYIFAADSAYKLNGDIKKLTEILDGNSNIAANSSITLADLAEGMSLISTQAADAGISADQASAALAAIAVSSNLSGSEAAGAFSDILSNLQEISSLEDIGSGKISLPETASPDSTKAFDTLLSNWDLYEQMLRTYADGSGSLMHEAKSAADSWEGALNRLSNTWTETVGNIVDSDAITGVLNGLNHLLSIINSLTEAIGPLGSAALGFGAILSTKKLGRANYSCPHIEYAEDNSCFLCEA